MVCKNRFEHYFSTTKVCDKCELQKKTNIITSGGITIP